MIAGQMRGDLGFSLNPVKLVKKAASGVKSGATAAAKGVAKGAKAGASVATAAAKNPLVQQAATFVPGGATAVAAVNNASKLLPGGGGGGTPAQAPPPAADGTVDLGPTQDAATAVAPPPAGGDMITLPGVGAVPKKTAMIGGAVLGGLVLVLLLRK